jgi:MSHA biogenesis protein MshM
MQVLRKLRLLFERFSKKNNLVLYGQRDKVNAEGRESTLGYLLHYLSLNVNKDIKSRITDSANIKRQNDEDIERYIVKELESVRMGINVFNEGAN